MTYLITANLVFTAFFLWYLLVLKRLTFFSLNRGYLLFSLFFSLLVPLLVVDLQWFGADAIPVVTLPEIVLRPDSVPVLRPVVVTAGWVYALGATLFAFIVLRSLWKIQQLTRSAEEMKDHTSEYFVNDGYHAFSFFHRIQIGRDVNEEIRDMVLEHELVHRRQWHSLDVLCFAFARIVCWFNPFMHMAAREVQLNHEFLADRETVARFGTDYQHSLLNQALQTQLFPLTNSFFSKSIIKKRIIMMNQKSTKRWSLAAYALVIPLIAGSLWLNSCSEQAGLPDGQQKAMNLSDAMTSQKTDYKADEVDEIPSFVGGQEALLEYFRADFKYPEVLKENNIEGRVVISFNVETDGSLTDVKASESDDKLLEAPAVEFVKKMPKWNPGQKDGKAVKVAMKLPLQYTMN